MPRIQPIPVDELADEPRRIIEDGVARGLYATPVPLQIFAYRTSRLVGVHEARTSGMGQGTLLGGRIHELIRIRSAQLGECQPCMQSRKHDSITDDDVACLLAPGHDQLDPPGADGRRVPRPAVGRPPRHRRREFYDRLGEVFTAAQIVELGFACANTMGLHRFLHTLDVYGTDPPVIAYDPSEVDSRKPLDVRPMA